MKKIFALVDCNNFYASCERLFNPAIKNKPIVVLSNNDGCVVARSDEAKALGISMGSPLFKNKEIIKKNKVSVFSSNYSFYGDMSSRVMNSLKMHFQNIEIYSIDEAFLSLDELSNRDLLDYCLKVRSKVLQWTGIPTSFGIAPTKTLAKIANHIAKKNHFTSVSDLRDEQAQINAMKYLPIESLWGISDNLGRKLRNIGITTALNLRETEPQKMRKFFGVILERMVHELRGISCLELENIEPKKSILSSKSFGKPLIKLESIEEALTHYIVRACEKLRAQKSRAQGVYVFLKTNRFCTRKAQYTNALATSFENPTAYTPVVIKTAKSLLRKLYRKGYFYHKCGVMLLDLIPQHYQQGSFFLRKDSEKSDQLMETIDKINRLIGKGTLFYGIRGNHSEWKMRCQNRSSRYTTNWKELAKVR